MGSCAAPSAKGDDKFITTDYLQQCRKLHLKPPDQALQAMQKGLLTIITVHNLQRFPQ
ncbi:hypothetical protein [Salmonella enterica]|uniref:hypothetical protein n=1 Tax=Salmonella enterica TaxID=28901 RepID=UPI00159E958C